VLALLAVPLTVRAAPAAAGAERLPDEAKVAAARKQIQAVFKDELKPADGEARKTVLAKLMAQAADEKNAPAMQYAALLEAAALAAGAGDVGGVLWADDEIERRYSAAAAIKVRLDQLEAVTRKASPPAGAELADGFLALADDAAWSGDFALASKVAARARAVAARVKATDLAAAARLRTDLFRDLGVAAKPARAGDTSARSAAFLCVLGEWDAGLPMLAVGDDDDLATKLAKRDLGEPKKPDAQVALADEYMRLATKGSPLLTRAAVAARAAHWYRKALPEVGGLTKPYVEKQLAAADAACPWRPRAERQAELAERLTATTWTWGDASVVMTFGRDGGVGHRGMRGTYTVTGPRRLVIHIPDNGDNITFRFDASLTRYTALGRGFGGQRMPPA
jgi:hypothetical protein